MGHIHLSAKERNMAISNKYHRVMIGLDPAALAKGIRKPVAVVVDVYEVLRAFEVHCPATAHALKKQLCPGQRGKGSKWLDLTEAVQSGERAVQLQETAELVEEAKALAFNPPKKAGSVVRSR